jgi:hypothetical protein
LFDFKSKKISQPVYVKRKSFVGYMTTLKQNMESISEKTEFWNNRIIESAKNLDMKLVIKNDAPPIKSRKVL